MIGDIQSALLASRGEAGELRPTDARRPWAAVALILRRPAPRASTDVLFIRRAERHDDPWSGHMALPGGRHDPGDGTLLVTAIRETREEVGLDLLAQGRLLGALPALPASRGTRRIALHVQPIVFELEAGEPGLSDEVAETLWAPLQELTNPANETSVEFRHDGLTYTFPGWAVGGRVVWGLTHRIVGSLLQLVVDNAPKAR